MWVTSYPDHEARFFQGATHSCAAPPSPNVRAARHDLAKVVRARWDLHMAGVGLAAVLAPALCQEARLPSQSKADGLLHILEVVPLKFVHGHENCSETETETENEEKLVKEGYDFSLYSVPQCFHLFFIIRSSHDWDFMSNQFDCILAVTLYSESLKNVQFLFRKGN